MHWFEKDNVEQPALKQVFSEEKYGDIVKTPIISEPDKVGKIKIRIKELGETHALYALAASLQERIETSRSAITTLNSAIRAKKWPRPKKK